MKRYLSHINRAVMVFLFSCVSVVALAQDKKVDININTKSDNGGSWASQPWVWIVGGAVFLLLLVALLRNNNSSKA